ncbi:unnamed protein product, partial [Ectocarpus sp. 12 AP-2014]
GPAAFSSRGDRSRGLPSPERSSRTLLSCSLTRLPRHSTARARKWFSRPLTVCTRSTSTPRW